MKKIMIAGIVAVMMLSVYSVYAQGEATTVAGDAGNNVQAFVGQACFKPGGFSDVHVLRFDQVGSAYQVTGHNPVYPSAMNGGGAIVNGRILLTITEGLPRSNQWLEHIVNISSTSLSGTWDARVIDINGVTTINYMDQPYNSVACPVQATSSSGPTVAGP